LQDYPRSTSISSLAEVEQDKLLLDSEKIFLKEREEDNRPRGEKESCYHLVGECYVHGLMDGKILNAGYRTQIFEVR
jgi:hypothetical protein